MMRRHTLRKDFSKFNADGCEIGNESSYETFYSLDIFS